VETLGKEAPRAGHVLCARTAHGSRSSVDLTYPDGSRLPPTGIYDVCMTAGERVTSLGLV
jgi:hypothetical protein